MMPIHHGQLFYNVEEKVLVLFFEVLEVIFNLLNCHFDRFLLQLVAGKLFQPTPSFPALQFLDSIEKGSNAEKAGLKQNDYVLEVSFLFLHQMFLPIPYSLDQCNQCHFDAT